jgi:hypothetical protein
MQDIPYYHCIARRVRRAWLWGIDDDYAGKDYSHRKAWVIDRLKQLCSIFPIALTHWDTRRFLVGRADNLPAVTG